ncbi:carboxymuconolactone decarboxylase family protein [Streptomyces qinglanensis]|uniref:Alkylhydroperoxidase family enzyme, contains CxxC motif n=1 Tax=Streptomyces qinglanensis TaxID=943816 RepID=A0A1H9S834_9ACTN|nr:carboxymuconolactone decarboxylase family protein [Streptomyces qinglanensis]SER81121.1 Alkylhydroperoxidase family enzyme, contains CxxC motif [Streptomyces qinglanensis]
MARISLEPKRTLTLRVVDWYARRKYGKAMEPASAMGYHPKLLRTGMRFELGVMRWRELDEGLKHLAVMASAVKIGCTWCTDFGYWEASRLGLPLEKISKVPVWREHRQMFTEVECWVLEYAEVMTETPPEVTDELVQALVENLGEPALVELTMMVAVENQRSRFYSALGLVSQGFSESCAVPTAE